jgi:hypothetical protein
VFLRLPTEANDKGQVAAFDRFAAHHHWILSLVGHVACSRSELGTPPCLTSEQFYPWGIRFEYSAVLRLVKRLSATNC